MRENATDKKIRLGEVASALGVAPKLIRNWTASQSFDLVGQPDRDENKWREYSYLDVAHLAIAAQIIRYGFSISDGHDFAADALARMLGSMLSTGSRLANAPAGVIEAICRGKSLFLFKLSDGNAVSIMTPMDQLPRYPAAVHVDLETCVGVAFRGLAEMGHDAYDGSGSKERPDAEVSEANKPRGGSCRESPEVLAQTASKNNAE